MDRPATISQGADQVRCMATDAAGIAAWLLAHVGMIHATHEHYSAEVGATLSYREICHILHMPKLRFVKEDINGKPQYDYDAEQLAYAATVLQNAAGLHRHYGTKAIQTLDEATAFRLAFQRARELEEGVDKDPDTMFVEPDAYFNKGVARLEAQIFSQQGVKRCTGKTVSEKQR